VQILPEQLPLLLKDLHSEDVSGVNARFACSLTEVGGEHASDVAEIDLALGAVHPEQLAVVQVVVIHNVWVVLQDELVVALLADHLQGLAAPHHVGFPAWASESQYATFRPVGAQSQNHKESGHQCQGAHLGSGGRHNCGIKYHRRAPQEQNETPNEMIGARQKACTQCKKPNPQDL